MMEEIEGNSTNNLEQARSARGLTQQEVAAALGISRQTYSNIESGKRELTISQVNTLAAVFRISFNDIIGIAEGEPAPGDSLEAAEKYKQLILNLLQYGAGASQQVSKTKLALLAYLADLTWYYLRGVAMSGVAYRKLPRGPMADLFFRALDELEENGLLVRALKGRAVLFSLVEHEAPTSQLSESEQQLIQRLGQSWQDKSTADLVRFVQHQAPWQICREGEVMPYSLIKQERPERVYGPLQAELIRWRGQRARELVVVRKRKTVVAVGQAES